MLLFGYNSWEFWEAYDPPNSTYGNQKVTFDGDNKLILINEGETEIDVARDIYSNWKEWLCVRAGLDHPNIKWARALTAIGGQDITDQRRVGQTFFLENGWRIKPWRGNYQLTINGNIYTREVGENPAVSVSGVSTALTRSNLVDLVVISDLNLSDAGKAELVAAIWGDLSVTEGLTYTQLLDQINNYADKALTKTEFLALK
jgi:hypothetical protein